MRRTRRGTRTWNDVRGGTTLEGYVLTQDRLYNEAGKNPASLNGLLREGPASSTIVADLDIEITSTGYYDPGRTYGPPEDCYPPEGGEERHIVGAQLKIYDSNGRHLLTVSVPQDRLAGLNEDLADEVEAIEIDREEDDSE